MSSQSETIVRFAGHDLILTGNRPSINVITRAVEAIEKQPEYMTDIFNMSLASNEFYKFEVDRISILGERHFLLAISNQLMQSPASLVNLPIEIHDIIYQINRALNLSSANYDPNFAAQHRVSAKKAARCKIYKFQEHALVIQGEKHDLIDIARAARAIETTGGELSTTISDLIYKIEYAFDIDGIRREDAEVPFDPDFADQYLI